MRAPQQGQTCEVSSVVEHILHTDGVISSNLILRISPKALQRCKAFLFCLVQQSER